MRGFIFDVDPGFMREARPCTAGFEPKGLMKLGDLGRPTDHFSYKLSMCETGRH